MADILVLVCTGAEPVEDHDLVGNKGRDSLVKEVQVVLLFALEWMSEAQVGDKHHTQSREDNNLKPGVVRHKHRHV